MSDFQRLAQQLGDLVTRKQAEYGDSAARSGEIMRILYPGGVPPAQTEDSLLVVRVLDKLCRISQRRGDGGDAGGESPWQDIAGYGLLGWRADIGAGRVKDDGVGLVRCTKCTRELPRWKFYRDTSRKDGHSSHCRDCNRLYQHGEAVMTRRSEKKPALTESHITKAYVRCVICTSMVRRDLSEAHAAAHYARGHAEPGTVTFSDLEMPAA